MKFINTIKNNLSLLLRFICRSCENGNPDLTNADLDSRLPSFAKGFGRARRGNDRRNLNTCKLSVFKNLQPTTYNLQPSRGFTLIETLVAISILMVAVASPLTIAQKGLSSAIYAKDQIIASYLAQDAIEYIINLSGKNVASGCNWLKGDGGECVGGVDIKTPCGSSCIVDTNASTIASCGACDALNYHKTYYIYNNDPVIVGTNEASPFRRIIKIEEGPTDEALITVTMSWEDKGTTRTLVFYTRIFNWKS